MITEDLPPHWTRYTTDDGKDYFHNAMTNVTQWDRPPRSVSEDVYTPELKDLDLNAVAVERSTESFDSKFAPTAIGNETLKSNGEDSGLLSSVVSKGILASWCGCCDIELMQKYFDLSTNDFVARLRMAINPLVPSNEDLSEKPDFYGPFWIVTTAVIFLSGTANVGNILTAKEDIPTDWSLVYIAASMLYGALFIVPVMVALILRMSSPPQTSQKVNVTLVGCVYGYSFLWLIPCSILSILPSGLFKWLLVIFSAFMSCVFVRNHLWDDMSVDVPKARYALIALLFGSHGLIYVIYRLYFFT